MKFLLFLSNAIIPLVIFFVVASGFSKKQNIYDEFTKGASEGLKTVGSIAPTLIGLMISVGVLRASGFLDFLSHTLGKFMEFFHFPGELVPLSIVKMFSSSAATGLLVDLYDQHGPDSYLGTVASIMMSSTETIFYTMSVYFMAANIQKSRYTLAGALFCTIVGIVASVFLSGIIL